MRARVCARDRWRINGVLGGEPFAAGSAPATRAAVASIHATGSVELHAARSLRAVAHRESLGARRRVAGTIVSESARVLLRTVIMRAAHGFTVGAVVSTNRRGSRLSSDGRATPQRTPGSPRVRVLIAEQGTGGALPGLPHALAASLRLDGSSVRVGCTARARLITSDLHARSQRRQLIEEVVSQPAESVYVPGFH